MRMPNIDHVLAAFKQVLANRSQEPLAVQADTPLRAIGLDSLEVAEVLIHLEEHGGCELSLRPMPESATIRDFTSNLTALPDHVC